jgi:hypothetical protein
LLKTALLLGVKVRYGTEFVEISKIKGSGRAKVKLQSLNKDAEKVEVDVLIGADGEHSKVAEQAGFQMKSFKAGFAIGVTANFENASTPEELSLDEFGYISYAKQEFFAGLKEKFGLSLENLVYYRDETHYFVMTPSKECLLTRGVLRSDSAELLDKTNVNREALLEVVRDVASYCGLPESCKFSLTASSEPDVDIFDFTKKESSVTAAKMLSATESIQEEHKKALDAVDSKKKAEKTKKEKRLLICLVGDALVAPFWPLGTGANRAILSAQDTAWFVKCYCTETFSEELLNNRENVFKCMSSCTPETLQDQFSHFSFDPSTRYKKSM